MRGWLVTYIKEDLRKTFIVWDRHEAISVLAVSIGSLAIGSTVGWTVAETFNTYIGLSILTVLGIWFCLLFLVVTPARMWNEQRLRAENAESRLEPGLILSYDPTDSLCREVQNTGDRTSKGVRVTCRVKVKAVGTSTVDDVRVVLLHTDAHTFYGCVFRPVGVHYRESGTFTLHPGADVYIDVVEWHAVELGRNEIQQYANLSLAKQPGRDVPIGSRKGVLPLRAEGRDVQACEKEFYSCVVDDPDPYNPNRVRFMEMPK